MIRNGELRTATIFFFIHLYASSSLAQFLVPLSHTHLSNKGYTRKFEIADDMFWKDDEPFRIIGGDLHYFRILPEYWEDRLLRAKALGLNTIQTYVPWNLHEPTQSKYVFEGIADLVSFLQLCQRLDLLVMLRAGPYICGEWDFGGFPAWLLGIEPAVRIRSSDPAFLKLVDTWWEVLLGKVNPLLYNNGGPIIMVQIENEFGSYGNDQPYLHHLVNLARRHLGDDVILYTTDGGSRGNLENGTIKGDVVYSAVDFTTGDDPWPVFELQKKFNAPGKSPPLSTEFYTGWLTHWGEVNAETDANFTATALEKILSRNGSAVLYMAHGGTNFGFYSGANTAGSESEYRPDLTSYDYVRDAPISESGDVSNAKFRALQSVISHHTTKSRMLIPRDNEKIGYGRIQLQRSGLLFDILNSKHQNGLIKSKNPISMEAAGQMFGFLLYVSEFTYKADKVFLSIPKVHDRAQVYVSCTSEKNGERPKYIGTVERWSNRPVALPSAKCNATFKLFVLVENMGRVNYGQYMFDKKGILSSVYIDGKPLLNWKMFPVPLHNLNQIEKINPIFEDTYSNFLGMSSRKKLKRHLGSVSKEPALYTGRFDIDNVKDTFLSFRGWGKGVAFLNDFNIGRFWPSNGPQCNLYVPAFILNHGQNVLVVLELESPNPELVVNSVEQADFTCGPKSSTPHQL